MYHLFCLCRERGATGTKGHLLVILIPLTWRFQDSSLASTRRSRSRKESLDSSSWCQNTCFFEVCMSERLKVWREHCFCTEKVLSEFYLHGGLDLAMRVFDDTKLFSCDYINRLYNWSKKTYNICFLFFWNVFKPESKAYFLYFFG